MTENHFDYENFLKECAEQDDSMSKSSKELNDLKDKLKCTVENYKKAYENYNDQQNFNNAFKLKISQQLKCLSQIKDTLFTLVGETGESQQEIEATIQEKNKNGKEFKNKMGDLYENYINLDSMFNGDKLELENIKVNKEIEAYKEKMEILQKQLARIQNTSSDNKSLQFETNTHLKKLTSEIGENEFVKNYEFYKVKINLVTKNIENLEKNIEELNRQLK